MGADTFGKALFSDLNPEVSHSFIIQSFMKLFRGPIFDALLKQTYFCRQKCYYTKENYQPC